MALKAPIGLNVRGFLLLAPKGNLPPKNPHWLRRILALKISFTVGSRYGMVGYPCGLEQNRVL